MVSLYKRKDWRTGKPQAKWTIAYWVDGKRRTEVAYRDKEASRQKLAQLERKAARQEVGLVELDDAAGRSPIAGFLESYLRHMRGVGITEEHVTRTERRLSLAFEAMGAKTLGGLAAGAASEWIAGRVESEGLALATRNHLVTTLHAFGEWLAVEREVLQVNPFGKLKVRTVEDSHRTRRPRFLTTDELRRLVEAAPPERALLYLFAAFTGFRRGEDKSVTWADLSIDGGKPTVTVRGKNAKNGKTVTIDIPEWLASQLRELRARLRLQLGHNPQPESHVFRVGAAIVKQLRQDAAKAGLGTAKKVRHVTPNGNVWHSVEWSDPSGPDVQLCFHGLRAFFCTRLFETGTPAYEVQKLARHASIQTTLKHYTGFSDPRLREAVDLLPNPFESVAAQVTATCRPSGAAAVPSSPSGRRDQGGQSVAL